MDTLTINEIFYSIQGETSRSGFPTTFVRLTGCPLRCSYCDTEYAFKNGSKMSFDEIGSLIKKNNSLYVTVTGGEPLAQKNVIPFLRYLCDMNYSVSIETSNAYDISNIDSRVSVILDVKTDNPWRILPFSEEVEVGIDGFSWLNDLAIVNSQTSRELSKSWINSFPLDRLNRNVQ